MKISSTLFSQLIMLLCIVSCGVNPDSSKDSQVVPSVEIQANMQTQMIIEVTSFSINSDVEASVFTKRDSQVEADFTRKQPGFIKRQSGIDENNEYVVVVYWESLQDAAASMNKFMGDTSVADYAQMIDAPTMKMKRYTLDKPFDAINSRFVELMSFDVNMGTDLTAFAKINQKVETDFTGKKKGFIQRLTGVAEDGRQVVAVYWASKADSDAVLQSFMDAPISKEFMANMDQASIRMGRYELLN